MSGGRPNLVNSPGPGLWSLVLGPYGPDLGPDLDLTWDLDLDLSLTISSLQLKKRSLVGGWWLEYDVKPILEKKKLAASVGEW